MNSPREFDFGERLAMSQGTSTSKSVREILLENIPGAVNALQAHSTNDRSGVDWWVEHRTAKFLSVDCKVRGEDWAQRGCDDLALESFSVVEKNIVGWTRDENKKTDYVLWLWTDTGRWLLIPFPMLCAVFSRRWAGWKQQFKCRQQRTVRDDGSSYRSECIFVPRRLVWAEIYKQYGGNMPL